MKTPIGLQVKRSRKKKNSDTVHTNFSEVFKTDETLGTAAEDQLSLKVSST